MSRPRITIDYQRVQDLAAHGLSQYEICGVLGISEDTLTRRKWDCAFVADALKKGRCRGAAQVANKLFEKALAGDLGAIIWYEKTRCGRTERNALDVTALDPNRIVEVQIMHAHEAKAVQASGEESSPTNSLSAPVAGS